MEDLKAVHSNWLSQAKKFRRASSKGTLRTNVGCWGPPVCLTSLAADVDTPIRLERGRLMCDGDVFERGELVMVTSELTGQTFYGSITSLGSIEVHARVVVVVSVCSLGTSPVPPMMPSATWQVGIRLADGTRSRVPISMLQQGRCKLRHQP